MGPSGDLVGGKISHYQIVARLGSGGMGVVYRARDERLGRDLALKVLPAESMADPTARARLLREARTASSLNHPNIAHIYEVGEDGDRLFIAMELVEGRTLGDVVPKGGLPMETTRQYAAEIADALGYAHERGVMHRDLKSANIMVSSDGRVKVLDFGLAKRLSDEPVGEESRELSLTASGMVVGTPNYLPPEVLLGGKPDARADVWAVGVVLYQMVSGRLPFGGNSLAELAGAIVNASPDPLSGRVPAGIRAVIGRCLAKDPAHRYDDGTALRTALRALEPRSSAGNAGGLARRIWIPAAAAALLLVAALFAFGSRELRDRFAGREPHPRITSLAVLPLANLSGDPAQEYFADGMTEELITNLAPIRELKVISRTSVMRFKGSKEPLRQIAEQLGVDGIIEGSVQRAGDRVRITAQLIEAAHDRHLWARSYERDFSDVLTLQTEVASDIAREIQLRVSPPDAARFARGRGRRPVNPEAFEEYLRGRFEWNKMTDESVRRGIAHFERALALDPKDARYSSGIADAYLVLTQVVGSIPTREGMAQVKKYAERALKADEQSAEAHVSMAAALFFGDWNVPEAERHVRRGLELNPGYGTAHLIHSVILNATGRREEALEEDRLAMSVDPLSVLIHWNAVGTLLCAKRFDEAAALGDRTFALDPTSFLSQSGLVRIRELRGDYPGALEALRRYLPESEGGKAAVAEVERAFAASGPRGYWRAVYGRLTSPEQKRPADATRLAMVAAQMGDQDLAMKHLERAFSEHSADLLFLNAEPCWDSLRGDPRFRDLVRRVGLTPVA